MEKERRLDHALFSGIVSHINRGEHNGEIETRPRGNGSLKCTWKDIKKKKTGCDKFAYLVPLAPRKLRMCDLR
jgi:hypothetical protein